MKWKVIFGIFLTNGTLRNFEAKNCKKSFEAKNCKIRILIIFSPNGRCRVL